jgi:glycosyltransferase involved in cell wall biosynthesis
MSVILSLCMIVKNESQNLPRCLASAKPHVDEIIVVDTGSEDDTPEIARQWGAKVSDFPWCDDFAAARNFSLSQVSSQWVLVLDADEELVVELTDLRSRLAAQPQVLGYLLHRSEAETVPKMTGGLHLRLFQNLPGFQYVHRYHEQLRYLGQQPLVLEPLTTVRILHYGNSDETMLFQKTLNRNIPILESICREEGLNLWLLDCLGRSYFRVNQAEKAQECYAEAFEQLWPHLLSGEPPDDFYWVPTLMSFLAELSLEREDLETVRMLTQRGLEWCPGFVPLNYMAGKVLMMLGFPLGAIAYFQTCIQLGQEQRYYQGEPFNQTLMTIEPACSMGLAYMQLKYWQQAVAAFELALSFDPNCISAQQNLEYSRQQLDAPSS